MIRTTIFTPTGYRTMELDAPLTASQNWVANELSKTKVVYMRGSPRKISHLFILQECPDRVWTVLSDPRSVLFPIVLRGGRYTVDGDSRRIFTGGQYESDMTSRVIRHNSRYAKGSIAVLIHL